tara:strand:+ start:245 stop:442 length:198 start_codon:yes stop_codon:yes gene_type:complete
MNKMKQMTRLQVINHIHSLIQDLELGGWIDPDDYILIHNFFDREKQKEALDDKMCEAHTRIVSSD